MIYVMLGVNKVGIRVDSRVLGSSGYLMKEAQKHGAYTTNLTRFACSRPGITTVARTNFANDTLIEDVEELSKIACQAFGLC